MNRIPTFLLTVLFAGSAFAQLPPGAPYDPAKHVNPVFTFVQIKDFKPSTYKEAQEVAGVQLMGLSKEVGTLQSVELAQPAPDVSKELKLDVKATFYPVVRQAFKIADGGEVVLHSFKPPKIQGYLGPRFSTGIPMPKRDSKGKDKRLGPATPPEEFEIRGSRGLLFDIDGALTVAWQEDGVMHTATSTLPQKLFFRVLDDLL